MALGQTTPFAVLPIGFRVEYPGLYVISVAGQGTLAVLSSQDDTWSATCSVTESGLQVIGSNPWIKSLVHDPERGVLAIGHETYVLVGSTWTELAGESQSSPVWVPGAGVVGLVYSDQDGSMELAGLMPEYDEVCWLGTGAPCVKTYIHGGSLAYSPADDALLIVGGQQGPNATLTERTHIVRSWRNAEGGLARSAVAHDDAGYEDDDDDDDADHDDAGHDGYDNPQAAYDGTSTLSGGARGMHKVANHGAALVGYDEVEGSLCRWVEGAWQTMTAPQERFVTALATNGNTCFVHVMDGGLYEWSPQGLRKLGGGASSPQARNDSELVWDALSQRLVFHSADRNETWTHDGNAWTRLEGARLPRGAVAMTSTPNGMYALGNLEQLYLLQGADWRPVKVPPTPVPLRSLLYDPAGRLVASGMGVYVLDQSGWQQFDDTNGDDAELFAFEAETQSILLFKDPYEGAAAGRPHLAGARGRAHAGAHARDAPRWL